MLPLVASAYAAYAQWTDESRASLQPLRRIALDGVPNMLLMGATPSASEPVVLIELMYIDPEQFAQSEASEASSSS